MICPFLSGAEYRNKYPKTESEELKMISTKNKKKGDKIFSNN